MIAGLNPYPAYKDSGVPWLGEVPAHWEVRRLKWVTRLQRGYDLPADQRVPGPFLVVSSGGFIGTHAESRCAGPGVVMGRYGSTDAVFYVEQDFWPHNTSLFVTHFQGNTEKWCYYLLRSITKADHAGKSAVPGLDRNDLFQIVVPVSPLPEQTAIVRFLDHADRRIQRYIRAKQELIALLEEQKQAIIHQAVTGRIDVRTGQPYPAYKPSGVEWLGDVPARWERRRLKTLLRSVDRRSTTGKETLLSLRRDHGVVVYAEHFARPPQGRTLVGFKLVAVGQLVVNRMQANNGLVFCSGIRAVYVRL